MQKRNVLNSPRLLELKKHRRRVILNKIFLSLVALLVVCAGFAYLARLKQLNIGEIEITGNKTIDSETIKASVEKDIAGYYLGVFPKTNILFYPESKIKDDLFLQFKQFKDITFSIKDEKTLEVSISEREAKYLWCGATLPQDTEKCYFMDETGFIFAEAPYFSGEVYFKFYGIANTLKGNFEKFISFKKTLENMGLKPVTLYIEENGNTEILLSGTPTKPEIIFKNDSDLQVIAENLEAALSVEPLQSEFKNKYASLEYIDLRYGNKVYYKFSAQGGSASGGK